MSCFSGIVYWDGRAVPPESLRKMASAATHVAPDGLSISAHEGFGFAHNLLAVDALNGRYRVERSPIRANYIVCDARIDDRMEFVRRLRLQGYPATPDSSDAQLLLAAFAELGEKSVSALRGDFALAIWDSAKRSLFLARDHFGVRPLFYAELNGGVAFASRIESLLALPEVSDELDEIAVGDFLMFGQFADDTLTIYKAIRRVPRACHISFTRDGKRCEQYWAPPTGNRTRYANAADYSHHFYDIFERCVEDRLEGDVIAAEMSGGLDSTSIVAISNKLNASQSNPRKIFTNTFTCQRILPGDEEGRYARIAADYIGVNNRQWAIEDHDQIEAPNCVWELAAEPSINLERANRGLLLHEMMSVGARVLLSGIGGDALFALPTPFPARSQTFEENLERLAELWAHRRAHGSLRGLGLRNKLLPNWARHKGWLPDSFPGWIRRDLALRTGMEARWWDFWKTEARTRDIHEQFARPWFGTYAQPYVDAVQPMRTRFPLWDVRLQEFCAALPLDVVWGKRVMITAMRPLLPAELLNRPKSPVVGDLLRTQFRTGVLSAKALHSDLGSSVREWVDPDALARGVAEYVHREDQISTWEGRAIIAPRCLSMWQNRQ